MSAFVTWSMYECLTQIKRPRRIEEGQIFIHCGDLGEGMRMEIGGINAPKSLSRMVVVVYYHLGSATALFILSQNSFISGLMLWITDEVWFNWPGD